MSTTVGDGISKTMIKSKNRKRTAAIALAIRLLLPAIALVITSSIVEASGASKAITGAALKRVGAPLSQVLRAEARRDALSVARPASRPLTFHRYTTAFRARQEIRRGLSADTHMTPRAKPGRPLSAENAKLRFGIRKPTVRETIVVPKDQPLRHNKAWLGKPGVGETTSPSPVPKGAVTKVVRLKDHHVLHLRRPER